MDIDCCQYIKKTAGPPHICRGECVKIENVTIPYCHSCLSKTTFKIDQCLCFIRGQSISGHRQICLEYNENLNRWLSTLKRDIIFLMIEDLEKSSKYRGFLRDLKIYLEIMPITVKAAKF